MPLTNHIAIYGGSFDPPHMGHEIACMWLSRALNAEKVIVAPTYKHYFGKDLIEYNHRLGMCRLMVKTLHNVEVSSAEKFLPHPNTTLNLLNLYITRNQNSKFAIIIGSDLLPELHKWHDWDEVAKAAKIIVVGRSGSHILDLPSFRVYQYPIELSAVSSSDVRNRIKSGKNITGLVSKSIKEYIMDNSLYYD